MKKILLAAAVVALPVTVFGQSAFDAYQVNQSNLRGTARFMSMGGAFTALGGDLSTLTQNPAGIGVYRSSEVGVTVDFDFQKTSTTDPGYPNNNNKQTKVDCNNFGYVGAMSTGSDLMPFFNWGASYSRVASFNRRYNGSMDLPSSISDYIAANTSLMSTGYTPSDLDGYTRGYNPYQDCAAPWMSILAYNAYVINPTDFDNKSCTTYTGLMNRGGAGVGAFDIIEQGYLDEYNINFGGNFVNTVYWGLGFGITDINYTQQAYYVEELSGVQIPTTGYDASGNAIASGTTTGDGAIDLDSWKHINGTGFNFKFGLIARPINEFRIGVAIHTPTYYRMTAQTYSSMGYNFPATGYKGWTETDEGYVQTNDFQMNSPWRFMVGAAGVLGGRAIISADYEFKAFGDMRLKDRGDREFTDINGDIKNYFQATHEIRIGAEYRVTDNVSVRAGFAYNTSPAKDGVNEGEQVIYTDGPYGTETTPSYNVAGTTIYGTCGVGYHYKNFYLDAAYVHRNHKSTFHAFDTYDVNYLRGGNPEYAATPISEVTDYNNNLVLTLGFRF